MDKKERRSKKESTRKGVLSRKFSLSSKEPSKKR